MRCYRFIMTLRTVFLLAGISIPCAADAASKKALKFGPGAGLAANASEMPVLSRLLDNAGWTATPELSGVFRVGRIFKDDGTGHSLMVRECFAAEAGSDPYTSAEVVSKMQAGVRVNLGVKVEGTASRETRASFGVPVHHTLERLAMVPTDECAAMLATAPAGELDQMYAVQEVLTAVIKEQSCGRIDASGTFVVAKAEAEIGRTCSQESLEPVAVAYRSVPVRDLDLGSVAVDPEPVLAVEPMAFVEVAPEGEQGCHWGEIETVASTMSTLTVNGQMMDVRGSSNRAWIVTEFQRCGHAEAAREFTEWRANRRATNIACATGIGCYPISVGVWTAIKAKKHRLRMESALLSGAVASAD